MWEEHLHQETNPSHDPKRIPQMKARLLSSVEYEETIQLINSDPEKYYRNCYSLFIQFKSDPASMIPMTLFNIINKDERPLRSIEYNVTYRMWVIESMLEVFSKCSSESPWN